MIEKLKLEVIYYGNRANGDIVLIKENKRILRGICGLINTENLSRIRKIKWKLQSTDVCGYKRNENEK